MKPEDIIDTRLDRLFKLLSFYKTDDIQPSDFDRLLNDVNPFITAATGQTMSSFKSSMGGGFVTSSTQDWKYSALQQLGLVISQRYNRIDDSFLEASNQSDRITFQQFYDFIIKLDALPGFNLTTSLFQKLFAEMDPHRKTYLTLKDWVNSLSVFNKDDHIMIELKNFL